jgi:hypothetical protein
MVCAGAPFPRLLLIAGPGSVCLCRRARACARFASEVVRAIRMGPPARAVLLGLAAATGQRLQQVYSIHTTTKGWCGGLSAAASLAAFM